MTKPYLPKAEEINRSKKDLIEAQMLDEEEQELLEAFERGELKSVDNLEEELAFAKETAANYFRKGARNIIRLAPIDTVI